MAAATQADSCSEPLIFSTQRRQDAGLNREMREPHERVLTQKRKVATKLNHGWTPMHTDFCFPLSKFPLSLFPFPAQNRHSSWQKETLRKPPTARISTLKPSSAPPPT